MSESDCIVDFGSGKRSRIPSLKWRTLRAQKDYGDFQSDGQFSHAVCAPLSEPMAKIGWLEESRRRTIRTHRRMRTLVQDIPAGYDFETFHVDSLNRAARDACALAVIRPGRRNPLLIEGDTGTGKTHLLCAVARNVLRRSSRATVFYASPDALNNAWLAAFHDGSARQWEKQARKLDYFLLEHLQFFEDKPRAREMLRRIVSAVVGGGGQVVITYNVFPRCDGKRRVDKALINEILCLGRCAHKARLRAPGLTCRRRIVRDLVRAWTGSSPSPRAQELLARRNAGNIRQLQGAVMRAVSMKEFGVARSRKSRSTVR